MSPSLRLVSALCALAFLALGSAPARAQWVPTGGPAGGRFTEIAAPDGALLASHFYASMRLADGVWTALPDPVGQMVAGGERVLARTADGLALSADAGATFTALPAARPQWAPLAVDGPALVADANDSLHVSRDGGASWAAVQDSAWVVAQSGGGTSTFPVPLHGAAGAVVEGDALVVAATAYVFGGVYRKAPADTAWVALLAPGAPVMAESVQPYGLVRHGGALWFSHSDGVHRSADGGDTWADVSAGLPPSPGYTLHAGAAGLVAATRGATVLLAWDGAGWAALPPPPGAFLEVAVGSAVYVATLDGVFAWDGAAWAARPAVVASSPVPLAADGDAAGGLLVGESARILRSDDGGASWTVAQTGYTGPLAVGGGALLAGVFNGLARSDDGGLSWTALAGPPLPSTATVRRPAALVWHGGAHWAAHGYTRSGKHGVPLEQYGNVFRSDDGGATWASVGAGLPEEALGRFPVVGLAPVAGGLWAATGGGCVGLPDGAPAWTARACPPGLLFEVVPDGAAVVARTSTGLYASDDGGASWAARIAGLPAAEGADGFWSLGRTAATASGLLFVGTPPGAERASAYLSDGAVWTPLAIPFPDGIAWAGFLEGADGTVYGGSRGHGLWTLPGLFVGAGGDTDRLALAAPVPNPTAGPVRVRYTLAAAGEATVEVVDVTGRRVAVLARGPHGAGPHEATWAGGAAGVYVVRLDAGGVVAARRVVVVR